MVRTFLALLTGAVGLAAAGATTLPSRAAAAPDHATAAKQPVTLGCYDGATVVATATVVNCLSSASGRSGSPATPAGT